MSDLMLTIWAVGSVVGFVVVYALLRIMYPKRNASAEDRSGSHGTE